jgi:hypothetical protein
LKVTPTELGRRASTLKVYRTRLMSPRRWPWPPRPGLELDPDESEDELEESGSSRPGKTLFTRQRRRRLTMSHATCIPSSWLPLTAATCAKGPMPAVIKARFAGRSIGRRSLILQGAFRLLMLASHRNHAVTLRRGNTAASIPAVVHGHTAERWSPRPYPE